MSKTIVFYCPSIMGHKLEYIHHLYEGAIKYDSNKYIVAVPEVFKEISSLLEWPKTPHIEFDYIKSDNNLLSKNRIKKSWKLNKDIRQITKKYKANQVLLIDLIPYFPFIVFQKIKVFGIIYKIYPYGKQLLSKRNIMVDYIGHWVLSKAICIKNIFVLNDDIVATYFNRKFKTNKYVYLPDPVPNDGKLEDGFDLRNAYQIPADKIILLHAGGLLRYKGTLQILNAINIMNQDALKRFCFVFAGRVSDEIKNEFVKLYTTAHEKANIVFIEGFVPFKRMNSLFAQSDYILIPYEPRLQSSGIIGIAALFNKPVVTTKTGVVGKLVKRYRLGDLLDDNNAETIKKYLESIRGVKNSDGSTYIQGHEVTNFIDAIFHNLK